jgi:hypothetical protein
MFVLLKGIVNYCNNTSFGVTKGLFLTNERKCKAIKHFGKTAILKGLSIKQSQTTVIKVYLPELANILRISEYFVTS